jgi:ParB-like chromosome segregation protein Spo0J
MHKIAKPLEGLAVPVDSIRPPDRLIKDHTEVDLSVTRGSLDFYGQILPIAVNAETKVIIAGVGRWMAVKQLGWSDIAAVLLDMTPDDARGYAITDNQSGVISQFNIPTLLYELAELDRAQFKMELTGFRPDQIADLIIEQQPEDLDLLLRDIDVSMAIERPIWAVIRTDQANRSALEEALTPLEFRGVKVERSYVK